VQNQGAALLIDGHRELVARSGADGAHITGIENFTDALETLKPDWIVGCGGLTIRHDAMAAAEAGADYVMFGEPDAAGARPGFDAILERVTWWAEVFEAPCVAFAASLDEIAPLVSAGADFIALGSAADDWIWRDPDKIAATLTACAPHLKLPEVAS
jgi:thiamine-phosphate pyrophosphorylase